MSPKDWSIPSYTCKVDGVSCGHDHTDVDRACSCARSTMTRYRVPVGVVYQNQPEGGQVVRRVVRELVA